MKNILIATNSLEIGGAETNIVELAIGLKKSGIYNPIIISSGGKLVKKLEFYGIKHYEVPLNNKTHIFKSIIKIKKILKKHNIYFIHAHARIPSILCYVASKNKNIPLITSVHFPFKLNWLYKKISKWGDKTIAVSEDLREYVLKNYDIKNKDVSIVINGIDTIKFNSNNSYKKLIKKYNLNEKSKKIVHVSRLDKTTIKTIVALLDIFIDLDKKIPGIEFIVVGDGTEKDYLINRAGEINLTLNRKAITFVGNISENVEDFDNLADLFVGVSRSAYEAMSCKKPVILSGNQGYFGVFTKEKFEIAYKTNFCNRGQKNVNCKTLKKDIIDFFTNTEERTIQEMCEYNRNIICKYYSKDKMINDMIDIYNQVSPKKNIVICGSYGRENSGDDAILFTIINQLKSLYNNLNITVLSINPKKTKKIYKVKSIYTFNLLKIEKVLRCADLFISGGGTLIQDVTSTRSLKFYLYMLKQAKLNCCKTIMYSCGIGPIIKNKNKNLVKKVLNNYVDVITLREKDSLNELNKLNIEKPEIIVSTDSSLLVGDYINVNKNVMKDFNLADNKKYFGVCIKYNSDDFDINIINIINYVYYKKNMIPVFIHMDKSDYEYSKKICNMINIPYYIIPKGTDFINKYSLINKMDLVFAMRLHSVIFSYIHNINVIVLSYDQKIDSFCNDHNISSCMSINKFNYKKIIKYIDQYINYKKFNKKEIENNNKKNLDIISEGLNSPYMKSEVNFKYEKMMKKAYNFIIIILGILSLFVFSMIIYWKVYFPSQYKLVCTIESGNSANIEEYISHYLNRFILDKNYQKENDIILLKNKKYVVKNYNVWEITVKFDNKTKFNYYTYVYFYNDGGVFYRLMIKYNGKNNNVKKLIYNKIHELDFDIKTKIEYNCFPVESKKWNKETLNFYRKIKNSNTVQWGIFTKDIKNTGIRNEVPNIESKVNYDFDVILAYFHLNEKFPTDFMNYVYKKGKTVELTLQTTVSNNTDLYGKSPLLEIYKGNYDNTIREIAKEAKKFKHPFLFRLNNEMNSDWASYSGVVNLSDPDIYIECWRRIYNIFEKEGVNNAIWIFNPNDEDYPPQNWNRFFKYYPGNDYVHMIGLTGYNTGTYYNDQSQRWRTFNQIYSGLSNKYDMFSKFPWIITEFSSSSIGGDKAKWIDDMFNSINKYKNIKIAVWFSYADYDKNMFVARPYWLDENSETIEAFKKGFSAYTKK